MLSEQLNIGQVVKVTSGKYKDRCFFIVKIINKDFVLISDGRKRKLDKPKLKKVKHLSIYNLVSQDVKLKLESNESTIDAFLRVELNRLNKTV